MNILEFARKCKFQSTLLREERQRSKIYNALRYRFQSTLLREERRCKGYGMV